MRPAPGDLIGGKYRIVRVIGDGGMGTVFEARHEVLGTAVALKFLHGELARRPGLAERFLQEARVSANIQSAHVTRVTDVDTTPDGAPYLVMELLSGESLQQVLDQRGKLPPHQAIDFALQVLLGLEAAHGLGVVHRDLKPDNIFVTPMTGGPLLKLIDFGIAKLRASNEYQRGLTRAGAMMGTPEYMAPEQLYSAADVDHRADIFSIGVILYEMLCGQRPADGDDAPEIVGKVLAGQVQALGEREPTLPPALVSIVHKAISPERNDRFESAHEMRLALAPFAGELSHAGRLAATPHPAAVSQLVLPEPPRSVRDMRSEAPPRTSSVPATLPPTDGPPGAYSYANAGKGSTEDAPPIDTVNERGSTEAAAPALMPPGPILTGPSAAWPAPPPQASQRGSRALTGILSVLLGALVTGGVVGGIVYFRRHQLDAEGTSPTQPPPVTTLTALNDPPAAPTVIAPTIPTADRVPPTPAPTPPPVTGPKPAPTTPVTPAPPTAAPVDAGATPAPTFPPFVLPSSLPSTLPPLPSGFPTAIPTTFPTTFPPIFQPPPANKPDGG